MLFRSNNCKISLNAVMFTRRKNAANVLQDFTAAAAVRQILIISTEVLQMPMILAVSYRKRELNVPLCSRQRWQRKNEWVCETFGYHFGCPIR